MVYDIPCKSVAKLLHTFEPPCREGRVLQYWHHIITHSVLLPAHKTDNSGQLYNERDQGIFGYYQLYFQNRLKVSENGWSLCLWPALLAMSENDCYSRISCSPTFHAFKWKIGGRFPSNLFLCIFSNVLLLSIVSTWRFATRDRKWLIESSWLGNVVWWRQCSDAISPASGESKGSRAWQVSEKLIWRSRIIRETFVDYLMMFKICTLFADGVLW